MAFLYFLIWSVTSHFSHIRVPHRSSPVVAENPKIRSFDTLVGLTPYTQPWHIVVTGHSINQARAGKTPGHASESPPKGPWSHTRCAEFPLLNFVTPPCSVSLSGEFSGDSMASVSGGHPLVSMSQHSRVWKRKTSVKHQP